MKDTTNDNSGYIAGLEREIASYTTEYTYWLDSIAANDSARLAEIKTASDSAIIKWKGALKSYQEADATVGAKRQAAETALAAFDALTTKNAKNIDAARKAILAYYTAAKANGAKFNKVPAAQGRVTVEVAGAPVYKYPYAMEDVMTVLADTTKTYSAYVEFDVNFFGVVDANSEETTTVNKYYNATSKTDVTLTYMEDVIATADKAIGEGVPAAAGTFLKELQDSSYIAFGPAANYINAYEIEVDNEIETNGYLHKQPTAADAKFVGYDNAGNYGRYLASLDEEYQFKAKNYKAIVADLQAAVAYWTAKWNIMVADRAAAQVAMEATAEAETEYAKQWNDREEELDELKNRIDRLSNMAGILKEAIMAYLPDEYKAQSTPLYDPKGFTNFLKNQVVAAQAEVDNKKLALAAAQYNAELALDGKYDVYSEAKQNLDAAMAELEAAQAKLDAALADLEKGLAIIAAVNGAE